MLIALLILRAVPHRAGNARPAEGKLGTLGPRGNTQNREPRTENREPENPLVFRGTRLRSLPAPKTGARAVEPARFHSGRLDRVPLVFARSVLYGGKERQSARGAAPSLRGLRLSFRSGVPFFSNEKEHKTVKFPVLLFTPVV